MSTAAEQLKEILKAHAFIKEYPLSGFIECACGQRTSHYTGQLDHLAAAILTAGWQAPIEDPEELTPTTFDERMQAIADTATRPRTHLTEICADLVEIAKNPALAAHKDLADQIREIASHL